MKKRLSRTNLSTFGFTLIEIAIVMSVIGVIVGAIWVARGNASDAQQASEAVTEVQTVSANILNILSGRNLSGFTSLNITSNMIKAQAIPQAYVDPAGAGTLADHIWSPQNFFVFNECYGISPCTPQTFRIALHYPSFKGCIALLEAITSCEAGKLGCPTVAYTEFSAVSCQPNQNNCPSTPAAASFTPAGPPGWQSLTPAVALAMCNANVPGGEDSVEFDYSL